MTGEPYVDEQPDYYPPELVKYYLDNTRTLYHCYLIELKQTFEYDIQPHNIVLAVRTEPESDIISMTFDLEDSRGNVPVHIKYAGVIHLTPEQVEYLIFSV